MEQIRYRFDDIDDRVYRSILRQKRGRKNAYEVGTLFSMRKHRRMTQQELSRRTRIAQGDISKIETGRANPSVRTLRRLADGLDCDLYVTFVGKEIRKSS